MERAKVALSTQDQIEVPLSSGLPDSIYLTREELEEVIRKSGHLNRTTECVLRAWRRARMLLRYPGESRDGFFLSETSSGAVSKSILSLAHADLREHIEGILLVGGSSQIPMVRRHLGDLWGMAKILPGSVVAPIEAVAIGAAWKRIHWAALSTAILSPFWWNGQAAVRYSILLSIQPLDTRWHLAPG